MDEISQLLPGLAADGVDLKAERARWQTLQAQVHQRGRQLLQAWPPTGSLPASRQTVKPGPEQWWWWLDQDVAAIRRRRLMRSAAMMVAAVAAIALAIALISRLLPVDPQVRELQRLRFQVEQALADQDFAAARDLLRQATTLDPADPGLHVQLGVAGDVLGDAAQAEAAWSAARNLLGQDEAQFYMLRGQAYLAFGRLEHALEDEQTAVSLAPDLASAYYFLGLAHELLGHRAEALEAYGRAAELAGDADPELVVLARTRLATLLQQPAPAAGSSPAP
jgi:tetratricopeptide (TPR) repeat protein